MGAGARPTAGLAVGSSVGPAVTAPRALRALGWAALACALGFAVVWAFLAYLNPDRVLDFASLLQMCGIPMSR